MTDDTTDDRATIGPSWTLGLALAALATPALVAAIATLDMKGFQQMPALASGIVTLALPYVGVALVAFGGARASGWLALALAIPVLGAALAALIIGGTAALGAVAYFAPVVGVPAVLLLLTQLGLALGGLRVLRGTERGGHAFAWTMTVALAVGVLTTADNAFRWHGSPERHAAAALGEAVTAHEAMLRAHRCLRLHARTHGAYPETLDALGACLGSPDDGFTLAYARRGDGFELQTRIADERTRAAYARVSDESGAVYAGTDRRSDDEALPGMVSVIIMEIDLCLEQYRLAHPARGYPVSLAAPDAEGFSCFASSGLGERMRSVVEIGEVEGYRYRYTPGPPDAAGHVGSFRLDVRPVVYGRAFRRSWLCTPAGTLHATDADRPAEPTDPDEQVDVVTGRSDRRQCLGPDVPARLSMR